MKKINFHKSLSKNTIYLSSGWLFADLLLALGVIFLVSGSKSPSGVAVVIPSTPTASYTSQPIYPPDVSAMSTSTITPEASSQVGLDKTPVILTINVMPSAFIEGNSREILRFQENLKNSLYKYLGKRAGLVITLGFHSNIGSGMQMARKGNLELVGLYPNIFGNSVMKPFWFSVDEINVAGTMKFEIYFLTD